ncbi:MAG: DUF6364 family protein [Bacteroidota bacterium]
MNTKLTLSLEQNVIEQAKRYAKQEGESLSEIVENYLKVLTREKQYKRIVNNPVVNSLKGSFKTPDIFNYKEELSKALSDKYE